MNLEHVGRRAALTALGAALTITALPGVARADDVVAVDTTAAATVTTTAAVVAPAITAAANAPRTIVVSNHGRRPVSLYAKGERRRAVAPRGTAPVRFAGLTPGRVYVVVVGGAELGRLAALDRPSAASGLVVRTTAEPDALRLTWQHRSSAATGGGTGVWYDVTATSRSAPTIRTRVRGAHTVVLTGLDRRAVYAFTVVPRNSAGPGRATSARMSRPLGDPRPDGTVPTTPIVAPAPGPTPLPPTATAPAQPTPAQPTPTQPAPTPPAPATKTVYVCPDGSTETATHACLITKAYTFTTKPYTFHVEATGPAPILDEYPTSVRACPSSHNFEDYGWAWYCRRYGPIPTATVKDKAPAGFADDGTQWIARDPAPEGFVDDGTQWIRTVAKEARTAPA